MTEKLRAGALSAVLIDVTPMHNAPTHHWTLAHAVDERFVYVQNPWINAPQGETWLDGHDMAISLDEFDAMARWGDLPYRAVVVIN